MRGSRYVEETRCQECAANIPLLISSLGIMAKISYECGQCGTEFKIERPEAGPGPQPATAAKTGVTTAATPTVTSTSTAVPIATR